MKLKTLLIIPLIISQFSIANEELDMSDLGNKLAVCSAKSVLLSAVLKDEKEYSEVFLRRSLEWRVVSIISLMIEKEIEQEDAEDIYEKVAGNTVINSGIKEVMNDKPELIKRSEELIYYIDKNCLPYDGYVERVKKSQ